MDLEEMNVADSIADYDAPAIGCHGERYRRAFKRHHCLAYSLVEVP